MKLNDNEIRDLAKDPGVAAERRSLEKQCDFLQKCLEELRDYLPAKPSDDPPASETEECELCISAFCSSYYRLPSHYLVLVLDLSLRDELCRTT